MTPFLPVVYVSYLDVERFLFLDLKTSQQSSGRIFDSVYLKHFILVFTQLFPTLIHKNLFCTVGQMQNCDLFKNILVNIVFWKHDEILVCLNSEF